MTKPQHNAYIKRTENMVRPEEVSVISVFGAMLGLAPVALQKKIMEGSTRKNPYMSFVVQPYALFLAHEITDLKLARSLIPAHFEIVPTRIFADDEPRLYAILGAFNVTASAFWGSRVELYIIAENKRTGMLSWVIVDYDSDTLSFDPGQGFVAPTTRSSTVTTTHQGAVLVDVMSAKADRHLEVEARLAGAAMTPLDQRLWLEGNLSVGYGGELSDDRAMSFGLTFEPEEMAQAWRVPLENVNLSACTWYPGLFAALPSVVACFPYAQHFITSQVPTGTPVHTVEQLQETIAALNASPPSQGFSSKKIRAGVLAGGAVSLLITISLIAWIALHYAFAH